VARWEGEIGKWEMRYGVVGGLVWPIVDVV